MRRIYLSGPITGVDDYYNRFAEAEAMLRAEGYHVINPAPLIQVMPDDATWEEFMQICIELMPLASAMAQMPGWEQSRGCNREYGWAMASDMIVLPLKSFTEKRR